MKYNPITRGTAPELIRLLDFCFRRGVFDAADLEDDYAVQEWYDDATSQRRYGILTFPDAEIDWKRWRFFLVRWCRESRIPKLGMDYIDGVRSTKCGFQYLVIPVTFWFYLQGVREWLEYPNQFALEIFKSKKRVHWSNKVPQHMRVLKNDDYISLVQECCYHLQQYPMPEMTKITPRMFEDFEMALWSATRKRR